MKRLLVFPFALGFCGALFFPICFIETIVSQWPLFDSYGGPEVSSFEFWNGCIETLMRFIPNGTVAGFAIGIGIALWDAILNRRDKNGHHRLLPNLFWCVCYLSLFIAVNAVVIAIMLSYNKPSFATGSNSPEDLAPAIFVWGTFLLNFTAIAWAAIRSITTDDVLTPRVLRDKLRERARLG